MTEGLYFEPDDDPDESLDAEDGSMPNYGQPEDREPSEVRYVSSADFAGSGEDTSG